jgi:transposase
MLGRAKRGEVEVAFVDETGFAQAHPNRSAWTRKGECHSLEARRGKRLNLVGAWLSSGVLHAAKLWHAMTADLFVGFLAWLKQRVSKPLIVILDNASIHKAKRIEPYIKYLAKQGLSLYFLPPYTPELNRIERLWHNIKYRWMAFKARDEQTLEDDVDRILQGWGDSYQMTYS